MTKQKPYGYLHYTNDMEHRFTRLKPRGELYPHIGNITKLFTAEQLKAERENAIRECAQKAVDITNDADVANAVLKLLSTDNHKSDNF